MQFSDPQPRLLPVPLGLLIPMLVSAVLLVLVGGLLLVAPPVIQPYWPWTLSPFNTRFLGAIYFSASIPLWVMVIWRRTASLLVLLPVLTCFTVYLLLVSWGHLASFQDRFSSRIWFGLYGVDSAIGLLYCWRLRSHFRRRRPDLPVWIQRVFQGQALALGGYGLGLLFLEGVAKLWPWPLDGLHAHLYSGVFVTGSLASLLLSRGAIPLELSTFGLTQGSLGLLMGLVVWGVDLQVQKLNWTQVSPWLWQGLFILFGLIGWGVMIHRLRQSRLK
jgi:hypothetical protein